MCRSPPFADSFDNEVMAFVQSGKRPLQAPESSLTIGCTAVTNSYTASDNDSSSLSSPAEQESSSTASEALSSQLHDMFSGLIALCWDHNPNHRPTFDQILLNLLKMVQVMHSSIYTTGKQQLSSKEALGRGLVVVVPDADQKTPPDPYPTTAAR